MTPSRTDAPGVGAPPGAGPAAPDEDGPPRAGAIPAGGGAGERPERFPEGCTPGELALAWGLVAALCAMGAYVLVRPGPTPFDTWALAHLPDRHHLGALVTVTRLGSPVVVVAGAAAAFLTTLRRNPARATALLAGPAAAVVASDWILKPAVGRTFEGVLSFPSGTTAAVSALGAAAVLAVPSRARGAMCAVALSASLASALAVVGLGWHYPSDAVGGIATGAGAVLVADSTLCRARATLAPPRAGDGARAGRGARR
ncbi:MAG TPA: phosphatase PAP2 family protein [Acidimicrobiales bacterium]|nr:phosphatase PAP2 family protein [Acidimicrobiales bacterium]